MPVPENLVATILLIDDDTQLVGSLKQTLEEAGFRALTSHRVDQAGRMLADESIDLILLEVATQHGEGWTLLREVADVLGKSVIVLTSHGREEDVVTAFNLGAADVITKPFRTAELLARIRARLREHRPRGAAGRESANDPVSHRAEALPAAVSHDPAPARSSTRRSGSRDEEDADAPVFMNLADEHVLLQDRDAVALDPGIQGVLSTKGAL